MEKKIHMFVREILCWTNLPKLKGRSEFPFSQTKEEEEKEEKEMCALNVNVLRSSFGEIKDAEEFGKFFYRTMFTTYPEVLPYFAYTNKDKQRRMLINSIVYIVRNLENMEDLVFTLRTLGQRHLNYKTEPEHYNIVGACLLKTLEHFIGKEKWTEEVKKAWTDAYQTIVKIMVDAAEEARGEYKKTDEVIGFEPREYELASIQTLSHDTKQFKFKLHHPQHLMPMPAGRHIQVVLPKKKKEVTNDGSNFDSGIIFRDYTPVRVDEPGFVDIVVKRYEEGLVSKYLHDQVKVGDKVLLRGLVGSFEFRPNKFHHYAMISAGTGICPMIQVLKEALQRTKDCHCTLLNCNKTLKDILLKEELEMLEKTYENQQRFKQHHLISRDPVDALPKSSNYTSGRINEDVISKVFPKNNKDMMMLICGPDAFNDAAVSILKKLGYNESQIFVF